MIGHPPSLAGYVHFKLIVVDVVAVAIGGAIPDGFTHAVAVSSFDLTPYPLMFVAVTSYL